MDPAPQAAIPKSRGGSIGMECAEAFKPDNTIHHGPVAITDASIMVDVYDPEIAIPGMRGWMGRGMRPR